MSEEAPKPENPKDPQSLETPDPLKPQSSTGGVLVLQWLTYAFWGWLIVGLIWLVSVILTNAIVGQSVGEIVPYAIAASVVLLPLAFISDLFYRRFEPIRKTGAAMVIMLIHAVGFALFGIGALIVSVFTGLNALINTADSDKVTSDVVLTAAIATLLFAAAFLRTLNPFKKKLGATIYGFSMLGLTVLLLIIAVVGPVLTTISTRDDKRTEQALQSVENGIQSYVTRNDKLPENLSDISIRSDVADDLIKDNKIEFKSDGTATDVNRNNIRTTFRYQLCVNYDKASEASSSYDNYSYGDSDDGGYNTYLKTTPHDAGRVCYKLRTY